MRAIGTLVCLLFLARSLSAQEPTGRQENVAFPDYSPLANTTEVARRGETPLASDILFTKVARAHQRLIERQLVPEEERYVLYVPPEMPPDGYGLLVFVPPWDRLLLPSGWERIFDVFGMIYIAAGHSGNEQIIFSRREPLALNAVEAVRKRYKVNPDKIFVGGLSGGSRTAERIALAYPDLFKGAYLAAGSDRLGDRDLAPPPKDLFRPFQEESRVVFSTGEQDSVNITLDRDTQTSFEDYCVFGHTFQDVAGIGHAIPTTAGLKQALRWLLNPQPIDQARLAACRARQEGEVAAALAQVRALQNKGDLDGARSALARLDTRYGGLAAPESLELARSLDPEHH